MPNNNADKAEEESHSPGEVRTAMDRIDQKRLAVQLMEAARYIVQARSDTDVCDEQGEMIADAVEQVEVAAEAVWPGDEMPELTEIAEGDWEDDSDGDGADGGDEDDEE